MALQAPEPAAVSDPGRVPAFIEPMLATSDRGRLVDDPRFAYEFKFDGYRAIMRTAANGTTVLTSRNNNDFTRKFPQLARGLTGALGQAAVLDGEIVALDSRGRPDFALLQNTARHPATLAFYVFDALLLGEELLVHLPYTERRRAVESLTIPAGVPLAIPPSYSHTALAARGMSPQDLLGISQDSGLEGLMCKALASLYQPGRRSPAWLKHPITKTAEVILCGWREGQGRLTGTLGGLLLGAHDASTGDLVYIGDVGTGWTDAARADLHHQLLLLEQPRSPFTEPIPRADALRAHWTRPELVGDVAYRQFTGERRLRHTAWRGLRPDRTAAEITLPAR